MAAGLSDLPEFKPPPPYMEHQNSGPIVVDHNTQDTWGIPTATDHGISHNPSQIGHHHPEPIAPTSSGFYETPSHSLVHEVHNASATQELPYSGPPRWTQEADSRALYELQYAGPGPSTQEADSQALHEIPTQPSTPWQPASQPYPVNNFPEPSTLQGGIVGAPQMQSASHVPWRAESALDDDAELALIEEEMVRVRERKARLQQMEELARQEADLEARRHQLRKGR